MESDNFPKIVIAGGTGFVGSYLKKQFSNSGYHVFIISRDKNCISWSDTQKLIEVINNAEMLINLAGQSVNCRHTPNNKEKILNSRISTTKILGEIILKCNNPPSIWINASAVTYYGYSENFPATENTLPSGNDFLPFVIRNWEKTFFDFKLSTTRQIALRISMVLGKNGGVIPPLKKIVSLGLGGKQGNGKQMVSWIHIEDLYKIICFLKSNSDLNGAFNCTAPHPIENKKLMESFRKTLNIPIGLSTPKFLAKIGALFMNTESELILKSSWALPERLLKSGYQFKFPNIEIALNDILDK